MKGTVFLIIFFLIPAASAFSGNGYGNSTHPYEITNCTQLQEMEDDKTSEYILINDIDCSDTAAWNDGQGFAPIGIGNKLFSGKFNGNNYTISDLYINLPGTSYVGLFAHIKPLTEVHSVVLENIYVSGSIVVGGLAGMIETGAHVYNIKTSGVVNGTDDLVGGIVGADYTSDINNSVSECTVYGVDEVGG